MPAVYKAVYWQSSRLWTRYLNPDRQYFQTFLMPYRKEWADNQEEPDSHKQQTKNIKQKKKMVYWTDKNQSAYNLYRSDSKPLVKQKSPLKKRGLKIIIILRISCPITQCIYY